MVTSLYDVVEGFSDVAIHNEVCSCIVTLDCPCGGCIACSPCLYS